MTLECRDGKFAVIDVALVIAVGEPCCDLSQVAPRDRLTAQRTERLRVGCPAIHQDEIHVPSPNEKAECGVRIDGSPTKTEITGFLRIPPANVADNVVPRAPEAITPGYAELGGWKKASNALV